MPTSSASLCGRSPNWRRCTFERLVGAVLAPHDAVHRQLGGGGPAAEDAPGSAAYSSALRPELGPGLLVVRGLRGDLDGVEAHAFTTAFSTLVKKPRPSVARAGEVLDRVLGVRHEADDPAVLAGHPGDVAASCRWGCRRRSGTTTRPSPSSRSRSASAADVAALAVLHRDDDPLARRCSADVQAVSARSTTQHLVAVAEVQVAVAGQRARQQPGLAEHLEAVADAEHRHARPCARATTSCIRGARAAMAPARR